MEDSDSFNPAREQDQEILVLQSIHMEEFRIPEKQPKRGRVIELRLLPWPSEISAENHLEVLLTAHLEPSYPILPPRITLKAVRGIDDADLDLLEKELTRLIAELAGHTQLMELSEHARDFLRERNAPPNLASLHEQMEPTDPGATERGSKADGEGGGNNRRQLKLEELARLDEVEAELEEAVRRKAVVAGRKARKAGRKGGGRKGGGGGGGGGGGSGAGGGGEGKRVDDSSDGDVDNEPVPSPTTPPKQAFASKAATPAEVRLASPPKLSARQTSGIGAAVLRFGSSFSNMLKGSSRSGQHTNRSHSGGSSSQQNPAAQGDGNGGGVRLTRKPLLAGSSHAGDEGEDEGEESDEGEEGESTVSSSLPVANRFAALGSLDDGAGAAKEPSRFRMDFVKTETLGKGGFGRVYRARNKLDALDYAVKVVHIVPGQDVSKILREVNALSRMHHENIVRYYNAWMEGGGRGTPRSSLEHAPSPKPRRGGSAGNGASGGKSGGGLLARPKGAPRLSLEVPRLSAEVSWDFFDRSGDEDEGPSWGDETGNESDESDEESDEASDEDASDGESSGEEGSTTGKGASWLHRLGGTSANHHQTSGPPPNKRRFKRKLYIQMEYCKRCVRRARQQQRARRQQQTRIAIAAAYAARDVCCGTLAHALCLLHELLLLRRDVYCSRNQLPPPPFAELSPTCWLRARFQRSRCGVSSVSSSEGCSTSTPTGSRTEISSPRTSSSTLLATLSSATLVSPLGRSQTSGRRGTMLASRIWRRRWSQPRRAAQTSRLPALLAVPLLPAAMAAAMAATTAAAMTATMALPAAAMALPPARRRDWTKSPYSLSTPPTSVPTCTWTRTGMGATRLPLTPTRLVSSLLSSAPSSQPAWSVSSPSPTCAAASSPPGAPRKSRLRTQSQT